MKKGWENILDKEVSPEARQRVFSAADKLLDEMRADPAPSIWAKLWMPMGAVSLAGAAAVAVYVTVGTNSPGQQGGGTLQRVAMDPELVRNVEMLLELETLEKWNPQKGGKVKKWKPKRS